MTPILAAALDYADAGLSILPWSYVDGAKVPAVRWAELQDRRWTADEVAHWWRRRPSTNVGAVTGAISDLVVVDCDDDEAFAWASEHLPPTPWIVRTGRGAQLGYRHPGSRIGNRVRIGGMALDLRGDGGYVSMPPSAHRSGVLYRWGSHGDHRSPRPVFDPRWLPQPPPRQQPIHAPAWTGTERAYRGAHAWMARREPAVEGAGGHDHTRATAWALARMGLTWDQAWPLLADWNATCSPPWSEDALADLLVSALRK